MIFFVLFSWGMFSFYRLATIQPYHLPDAQESWYVWIYLGVEIWQMGTWDLLWIAAYHWGCLNFLDALRYLTLLGSLHTQLLVMQIVEVPDQYFYLFLITYIINRVNFHSPPLRFWLNITTLHRFEISSYTLLILSERRGE